MKIILITAFALLLAKPLSAQTDSTQTLEKLYEQIIGLQRLGNYERATEIAQKAVLQAEKESGKQHPSYATSLNGLAYMYLSMGQYEKTLPLYQQALQIREQTLGKQHPNYATSLNNLAYLYQNMGQYEKALPLYQQALQIREQTLGKQHPDYATSLNSLAYTYQSMGQYEKALPYYQQALQIREQVLGKQHRDYATCLNNLALLYQDMGQYEKALSLYQQALQIREQVLGKQHRDYATSLNNLALLYQGMGQYEKALSLYQQTLQVLEQVLGKQHPNYASCLNNLAQLYQDMGQYEKALPYYQQALQIREQVLGKQHPHYASSLNNLAYLYKSKGQYEKALLYYQQVLQIREQVLGKQHPDYASSLNYLSLLYESMGQYEKALPHYQQALQIQERVLGKQHPDYASILNNLAFSYQSMGKRQQAVPLLVQARQIYKNRLMQDMAVLGEEALHQYQVKNDYNAFAYSVNVHQPTDALGGQNYNDALLNKGLGLLAIRKLRQSIAASTDTVVIALDRSLQSVKQTLNRLYLAPQNRRKTIDSLEKRAGNLEEALLLRLPAYRQAFTALQVEWQQVQQRLRPNEAAIEFVDFRFWNKRWTDSTYYAAVVLRQGWPVPKLVYLCERRQLDSLLATHGGERREDYVARLYADFNRGTTLGSGSRSPRRPLYSLIWQPIDSLLQGVNHIYYSPSGLLHRINLAALAVGNKQRLSDRYGLTLLSSTRQLAYQDSVPTTYTPHALLMGNVQYNLDSTAYRQANRSYRLTPTPLEKMAVRNSDNRSGVWEELVETGPEIETIAGLLRQTGFIADTLTGWQASEEAFYYHTRPGKTAPRYIHLATHGYFQEVPEAPRPGSEGIGSENVSVFRQSNNPLIRSGLGLAGGNHVFWQGGQPLAGQEDGVLTANEISMLDLRQTELVVLSACETGLGSIKGSEGVYGLQRAIKMAGVKNVIMSLWQVPDMATRRLMESFYGYYLREKMPVRQAFDKATQDTKRFFGSPYFWAGFVLIE